MTETESDPPEAPITPPPSEESGYEGVSGGETTPPSGAPESAEDREQENA
jgi:hypothetical protein